MRLGSISSVSLLSSSGAFSIGSIHGLNNIAAISHFSYDDCTYEMKKVNRLSGWCLYIISHGCAGPRTATGLCFSGFQHEIETLPPLFYRNCWIGNTISPDCQAQFADGLCTAEHFP